jgi:hypothetical protein
MDAIQFRQFFLDDYWKYFLQLESELYSTEKYVSFSKNNQKTSSLEYLLLFQAACSEIDTVGKAIAKFKNSSFKMDRYTNINKWGYELQQAYPKIEDTKIVFKPMHIYFEPWKNWEYEKKTTTDLKTKKGSGGAPS